MQGACGAMQQVASWNNACNGGHLVDTLLLSHKKTPNHWLIEHAIRPSTEAYTEVNGVFNDGAKLHGVIGFVDAT